MTSKGPDVLSKGLVQDPDDIEALMQAHDVHGQRQYLRHRHCRWRHDRYSLALALAPLGLRVAVVEAVARRSPATQFR